MDSRRKGETGRAPFRSGRFFTASGKWFFTTREGKDHGPFESKARAEAELAMFLRGLASHPGAGLAATSASTETDLDPWALSARR